MLPRLIHAPFHGFFGSASLPDRALGGIEPAAKVCITGTAACKSGSMVQSTASATVCGNENDFHNQCTRAKDLAKASLVCTGNYTAQHTGSCSPGAKCKNDGECD